MIALTQEKREELIKYYGTLIDWSNDRLSSDLSDFDRGAIESSKLMTEIALASLTAEPVTWWTGPEPTDCGIREEIHDHESGCHQIPLYTAPPVPEIKLPHQLLDLINAVEFYHKVKAENPDTETGAWKDAYDWIKKAAVEAAPVIKSLNGLGE